MRPAYDDDNRAADLIQEYEGRIAALERLVGRQALEIEFLKGGAEKRSPAARRDSIRDCRPTGLSIAQGCRLMGIPRSTFYDAPAVATGDTEFLATITAICDEFKSYGYRRVGAPLRHQGWS